MRRPEDNGYGVKSDITEAKLKYPVLYLGLSRLFPLGESSSSIDNHQIGMTDDEDIWFKNAYKAIVKSDVQITSVESLKFLETNKSLHAGINTDAYDIIGNSSGQNNISQILLALLSFRRISENTNYVGGLLLIDEFEATIHPSVQSNMLKFILETCHSLRLQVVLTTHSTSIFDFVHSKTKRNDPNRQNDIEFYYLSNSNGGLSIRRNPNPSAVYSDMHNISSILDSSFRRLTIYSEDDEARWMIRKLFSQYMHYIQLIEINVGSDELIKFDMSDPEYFSRVMIILDGDKGIDLSLSRNINKLLLPGNVRPEQVIYDYILSLNNDHEYFERYFGLVSKEIIRSSGPFSDLYNNLSEERDKFKKWFNDNLQLFEQTLIMDYWMNENQQEYSILLDQFKLKYNILASKNSLRRII